MEEVRQRKAVLELIRQAMPRVVEIVGERRKELGDAFVIECQRRGLAGEPGWFYAWEGGIGVGTPWADALAMVAQVDPKGEIGSKAVVVLKKRSAV